jgi:hypothetical protein
MNECVKSTAPSRRQFPGLADVNAASRGHGARNFAHKHSRRNSLNRRLVMRRELLSSRIPRVGGIPGVRREKFQ